LPELHAACEEVRLFELPSWQRLWNGLRAIAVGLPFQAVANWHPSLAEHIRQVLTDKEGRQGYDLVHIEHLRGARFGLLNQRHADHRAPVIWDAVDSVSLFLNQVKQRSERWSDRVLSWLEGMRVELYESWLLEQFDRVLVTSQQDQHWLLAHQVPGKEPAEVIVLPNGVDLDYFHVQPAEGAEPNTIVLTGNMALQANIAMAEHLIEEIMPLVWGRLSHVQVIIAGQNPTARVRKLAKDHRVLVTGTVEDIRPYLRRAVIAVAPLMFNLGIQNKVLEAMASGRPVIASPQAISGLQVTPGVDVFMAEDSIQFAEMLIDLLQNIEGQHQLARAGLDYVSSQHRWPAIVEQLERVYFDLTKSASEE
jgi:glycosyltransferase involved in cell wall biosynthesis